VTRKQAAILVRQPNRDAFAPSLNVRVTVQYLKYVAGSQGSARAVNGTHQDVYACERDGVWHLLTPRQLRANPPRFLTIGSDTPLPGRIG
jgi:hypothetical protein